jgi:hypothetical protein
MAMNAMPKFSLSVIMLRNGLLLQKFLLVFELGEVVNEEVQCNVDSSGVAVD